MIELSNVVFRSGGRSILNSISLQLDKGRFHIIAGPNGAGKSTLLKLMSRELRPGSGDIFLGGQNLGKFRDSELARVRAVLAQHNAVSLPFTVSEVVMMGRYPFISHNPSETDDHIVIECLRKAEVSHLSDRLYPVLSGGEKQRVQLARTLAQLWTISDGYFFLDEPTTGMDLKHQFLAMEVAKGLTGRGHTVVAVLHDLNMTFPYADQVILMEEGHLYATGTAETVITREAISRVFGVDVHIWKPEGDAFPVIVPATSGF
jgi:iron complex transport system ATP-binding protein